MVIRKSFGDSVNMSAHGCTFIHLLQLQRARTGLPYTCAFGRKHMTVTGVLLLRRALGPKVREGPLHPSSFPVLAASKAMASPAGGHFGDLVGVLLLL